MLQITSFTVEYRAHALGIDEEKPRFSWVLGSDRQNTFQSSYTLTVRAGDTPVFTGAGGSESVLVEYAGEALKPRTVYTAELVVTDNYGNTASAKTTFETGVMGDLKGEFVGRDFGDVVPELSRTFTLAKKPVRARIYATALGVMELFVNGKRVGEDYDAPGWTSYSHRLQYETYDVTALLHEGENTLSALIGKGWYSGVVGYFHTKNNYGDKNALLLELALTFEDGSEQILTTDQSWTAKESALRFSEFQDGELFDATFEAKESFPVEVVSYPKGNILAQIDEPVRVTERISGKQLIVTPKGEKVIDFGQNATGIVEFTAEGTRGQKVTLSHAEVLDEEGNFYTANLRAAKAQDTYILAGGKETFRPHFTFHGFRYAAVEGVDPAECIFEAVALSSRLRETGQIQTSDPALNRLISNIKRSQRDNFLDVPTDCPQRDERCGWTADANVFAETAAYNYDVKRFFRKWLRDLVAEQLPDGSVPYIVPNVGGGTGTAALWADAVTMIPFTMYRMYGELSFLEEAYSAMRKYAGKGLSGMENGLIRSGFQYGDWLALDRDELMPATGPGSTDSYFVANVFFQHSLCILRDAAELLGREAEAGEYRVLQEEHLSAVRREYFTPTGRMVSETQTALTLALYFHIAPDEFRSALAARLAANLERHGNHLTTGFAGTPYLLFALSENGYHDRAVSLLLSHSYPGWLYAVDRGATTIWERWNGIKEDGTFSDPSMNSFNHYAYGSVGAFLYRGIAGIAPLEPGFSKISLTPRLSKGLPVFQASFESPHGVIRCGYRAAGGEVRIEVTVPQGVTAELTLPNGERHTLEGGAYSFTIPCGDLSPERLTLDTKVGDILSDPALLAAVNKVSGNLFASPRMAAVKDMTVREMARLGGDASGERMKTMLSSANALLNHQDIPKGE